MKKLALLTLLVSACLSIQAQAIEFESNINDSVKTYTTSSEICRSFTDKMVLSVSMTKYTMASGKNYYTLGLNVTTLEQCSIPKGGRVLIKTADNSVIELKSILDAESELNRDYIKGNVINSASVQGDYIVCEADLQKMFQGVSKIRMEITPNNYEKTFKKDKIGKVLQAEYDLLKDKKYSGKLKSNFSDGF